MICRLCCENQVTTREHVEPKHACDECLAALGDIRVWQRESKRTDTLESALTLLKMDLKRKVKT